MGYNKVIVNGVTKVDLTSDTVSSDTMLESTTAHNAAGDLVTGTIPVNPQLSVADGGAVIVPQGYYSGSELIGYLLPIPTAEDAKKVVRVNDSGTGYELVGTVLDPLNSKKILIAGDSVAFGYGWEGGFKNLIEEDFRGAEVKNVAVSGAKLTQNQILQEISNAIYTQGFQPDIVIFDGGWNDLMEGVETGTVDFDTYDGTQNSNSNNVLGALEYLFSQFQNLFPEIQLVYFSIYKIVPFTGDSKTMPSYSEQRSFNESIKSVCQKYGVAFVDFWNCGAVTPSVSNNAYTFFYDFMHVNEAGYRMLWPVLKEKLFSLGKNVLIPNGDEVSY